MDPRLLEHRRLWEHKPTLRLIYSDYHRRLLSACPPGPVLDIGSGSAHIKASRAQITCCDLLPFPGIDVVCDAHDLPFRCESFSGIIMLDVLHHLVRPVAFLKEAARVLRPGGVLAMIEPGMSSIAYPFYRHLHQEPADMRADPFAVVDTPGPRDPFDSNQAIPTLLFTKQAAIARLGNVIPELSVRSVEWLSLFAYPLSGGFKRWCLIPASFALPLIRFEDRLSAAMRRVFGFRLSIVLERDFSTSDRSADA